VPHETAWLRHQGKDREHLHGITTLPHVALLKMHPYTIREREGVCVCVCVCEHDQHFSQLTFSFSIINIIVFNIFQTNQTMAGACRGTAGRVHRRTVLCVWAVRKQQLYSMSFFFTAPLSPTIFFPAENNLYTSGGMLYIVTYSVFTFA